MLTQKKLKHGQEEKERGPREIEQENSSFKQRKITVMMVVKRNPIKTVNYQMVSEV